MELLPFVPDDIDAKGRVAGVTQAPDDPLMASPTDVSVMPRGVLWDRGRLYPLGPATAAWFGKAGEIRGYYEVDETGKRVFGMPIKLTMDPSRVHYRTFVWVAGHRTEMVTLNREPSLPLGR